MLGQQLDRSLERRFDKGDSLRVTGLHNNKTNIGARVARMHYGIASFVKFDPTIHDPSKR
jgi:hypothetical protein